MTRLPRGNTSIVVAVSVRTGVRKPVALRTGSATCNPTGEERKRDEPDREDYPARGGDARKDDR